MSATTQHIIETEKQKDLSAILQEHTEALQQNNALLRQMLEQMEFQQRSWYTPEEAKRCLGFPPTNDKYAQSAKLKWLRDKGFLHKFIPGRPIMYDAENVREVAKKLANGKIYIPSKL